MRWLRFTGDMSSGRRFSAALLALAALPLSTAAARSAGTTYTMDTPIEVVLTARVSSETAHVGDTFAFKTASDVRLGEVTLPAGTLGSGRLATAVPATRSAPGQLALQADELMGPTPIWINIDTTVTPRGHYSTKRDIVLDPGVRFRVVTIAPRHNVAPLVNTQPADTAASPLPSAAPSPVASAVPSPSASP